MLGQVQAAASEGEVVKMAMAFYEREELNQSSPIKIMGERMAAQRSVPARSRAATARKLQENAEEQAETTPRTRRAAATARTTKVNEEAAQREMQRVKEVEELEARRDQLVERLDTGAARIEEARAKGKDVREWEDYWIGLLRHYEQVCDKLREISRAY